MTNTELEKAKTTLKDASAPLDERIRALYSVKNIGGKTVGTARVVMASVDRTVSVLLQHELLYNLGQFQIATGVDDEGDLDIPFFLENVIKKRDDGGAHHYNVVSRHEAIEALGAIFASGYYYQETPDYVQHYLEMLRMLQKDEGEPAPIRESAELAVGRIEECLALVERAKGEGRKITPPDAAFTAVSQQHPFVSIDPTPSFPLEADDQKLAALKHDTKRLPLRIELLKAILLGQPLPTLMPDKSGQHVASDLIDCSLGCNYSLYDRYRAMFSLRNIGTEAAVMALCEALDSDKTSALLRHEVAFVLGQLEHPASVPALGRCVDNASEHEMVRHEAAEAIGAVANEPGLAVLRRGVAYPEAIVADSCIVALEMHRYWTEFNKGKLNLTE